MSSMTPKEIVSELDRHIVGQQAAKRAVAIALRNRWRRAQVPEPLREVSKDEFFERLDWKLCASARAAGVEMPDALGARVARAPAAQLGFGQREHQRSSVMGRGRERSTHS